MKKSLFLLTMTAALSLSAMAQTKMIAHRGAWKNTLAPQNSLASLQEAIQLKAWGSEFDVHLTQDDVLVVNHDHDFYGIDIATATYAELLTKKHPNGESIPTAEEYLKAGLTQHGTKMIYELKSSKAGKERTLKAARMSVDLVKQLHAEKLVEYILFDYEACLAIKKAAPKAKVHYLNGDKSPKEIKAAKLDGIDYHITVYKKNPSWIQEARGLKLKTNVWTVNTMDDINFFKAQHIDYITTDEPEFVNKLLEK